MLKLYSPAKINLFLRILNKRPDGYHELASLMQTISLHDTLDMELSTRDVLTCDDSSIPTDYSNLVLKAADLFRRKTGQSVYLKAHLTKRIPHQAGLGGGSSNAATTLWGLNKLTQYGATDEQLAAWAGEIGSDISFFFSNGTAYCTGRGETFHDLPHLPSQQISIIKPAFGLPTALVYQNLSLASIQQRDPLTHLNHILEGSKDHFFNDMEDCALRLESRLAAFKKQIEQRDYNTVVMSGSGSAFFCFGEHKKLQQGIFCERAEFINRANGHWF